VHVYVRVIKLVLSFRVTTCDLGQVTSPTMEVTRYYTVSYILRIRARKEILRVILDLRFTTTLVKWSPGLVSEYCHESTCMIQTDQSS
jgi:hypothetical protein